MPRRSTRWRPPAEEVEEVGLRPRSLAEFVGPAASWSSTSGSCSQAARQRAQPVDHILFAGPPGLGKTSLAGIVATEMGAGFRITAGPRPDPGRRPGRAAHRPAGRRRPVHRRDPPPAPLGRGDALLRPWRTVSLDILIGKGPTARSIRLELPELHAGGRHHPDRPRRRPAAGPLRLRRPARPLRRRPTCAAIVERSARHPEGARSTPRAPSGSRSGPGARRGWPTGSCAGCATSPRCGARASSTAPPPATGSSSSGWTSWGWTRWTGPSWTTLCGRFGGQPVGLTTLAQCVGEETDTIEDAYEPFLLQRA